MAKLESFSYFITSRQSYVDFLYQDFTQINKLTLGASQTAEKKRVLANIFLRKRFEEKIQPR